MHVFPEARYEFSFRLNNIDSINGKVMSPKSSAVGVVYSDASDSGFWWLFRAVRLGFSVRCLVPRGKVKVKYTLFYVVGSFALWRVLSQEADGALILPPS